MFVVKIMLITAYHLTQTFCILYLVLVSVKHRYKIFLSPVLE